MPSFSRRSREHLETCGPQLQELFNEVIRYFDCSVTCGHRSKEDQVAAFTEGRSKVEWPNSKHNTYPSKAVDVVPYPVIFPDKLSGEEARLEWCRWYMFVGAVKGIATQLGIQVRAGADWDGDMQIKDQNFHDLPHWELVDD